MKVCNILRRWTNTVAHRDLPSVVMLRGAWECWSTLAIPLHLLSRAASCHGAPTTALILACIEKQPPAGCRVVTAAKPRDGRIAKQLQSIEGDALQR
jgi:hypothetical protein